MEGPSQATNHLVSKDSDGGGAAHLTWREPGGGQLGRNTEDEDLADCHGGLAQEGQPELVRAGGEHLGRCGGEVQDTMYKVQGTRYKVQGTRYKVQGTGGKRLP